MTVDLSEEARRAKVWLLYLKHTRGDRGTLSLNILREICAFLHPLYLLAHVTESSIQLFNFQTTTWAQVPLTTLIQVDEWSRWVFLEDGRVFCCGGYAGWKGMMEAWMIGVGGTVERQPVMNGARCKL